MHASTDADHGERKGPLKKKALNPKPRGSSSGSLASPSFRRAQSRRSPGLPVPPLPLGVAGFRGFCILWGV